MARNYDCVVIGAGPAGIFTALELKKHKPELSVLVVDSGSEIAKRECPARKLGRCISCQPCGILHGWSGAGAFSDGKLSLSSDVGGQAAEYLGRPKAEELIKYADSIYLSFGAPEEVQGLCDKKVEDIAYEASRHNIQLVSCPVRHLGTDRAFDVLKAMYDHLMEMKGFEFMPRTTAKSLIIEDGKVKGAILDHNGEITEVFAPAVVAAPGRGGAQWLADTCANIGIQTVNNEIDIGVRVEVPNSIMDHLTEHLYEAKLVYYSDTFENRVRTFCMNPGGVVSSEYYEGGLAVVNGHSYSDPGKLTENTNFALLVSTHFTEPFNEPIEYGRYIARLGNMLTGGGVMVQRLGDLEMGRRTTESRLRKATTRATLETAVPGDLSFVLPHRHLTSILEALKAFDKLAPGLYSRNTLLYGVEVKFYSSKVAVNGQFMTAIEGLYAIGDGAGITRGLMQASVTGVVVARDILGIDI
jgi:uncharacterized FAD-dependent dehydrogenase